MTLVRPRGRRRLLEDEQDCSSLTRSPLSSVVLLCPCLFLLAPGSAGGCAALSYVYANSGCVAASWLCVSCELVCVCVSFVRVAIICPASTHTALVSSPSLTVVHLSTYIHTHAQTPTMLWRGHMLMILARLVRSESFWAVVKIRSPHTGPEVWYLRFFCLSAQLRPPRSISWPLESIELSSRKDESSDAHCDHLPPPSGPDARISRFFRVWSPSCGVLTNTAGDAVSVRVGIQRVRQAVAVRVGGVGLLKKTVQFSKAKHDALRLVHPSH